MESNGIHLAVVNGLAKDLTVLTTKLQTAKTPKEAYALWHYITHYYAERIEARFEQFDSQDLGYVGDSVQFPKLGELL